MKIPPGHIMIPSGHDDSPPGLKCGSVPQCGLLFCSILQNRSSPPLPNFNLMHLDASALPACPKHVGCSQVSSNLQLGKLKHSQTQSKHNLLRKEDLALQPLFARQNSPKEGTTHGEGRPPTLPTSLPTRLPVAPRPCAGTCRCSSTSLCTSLGRPAGNDSCPSFLPCHTQREGSPTLSLSRHSVGWLGCAGAQ